MKINKKIALILSGIIVGGLGTFGIVLKSKYNKVYNDIGGNKFISNTKTDFSYNPLTNNVKIVIKESNLDNCLNEDEDIKNNPFKELGKTIAKEYVKNNISEISKSIEKQVEENSNINVNCEIEYKENE